jgi:hypothetical protein
LSGFIRPYPPLSALINIQGFFRFSAQKQKQSENLGLTLKIPGLTADKILKGQIPYDLRGYLVQKQRA